MLSVFADFDAHVSIYSGTSCDSLTCVVTNAESPIPGPRSLVAERLEEGQVYYVVVHVSQTYLSMPNDSPIRFAHAPFCTQGFGGSTGDFNLAAESLESPSNDECTDAEELGVGESVDGDTLAAAGTDDLPFCGS